MTPVLNGIRSVKPSAGFKCGQLRVVTAMWKVL